MPGLGLRAFVAAAAPHEGAWANEVSSSSCGQSRPSSFAYNYGVPDAGNEGPPPEPPAPPMRHASHKEKLPQYGSPYLCYPMVGLKAPDGAQATPTVSASAPLAALLLAPSVRRSSRREVSFL
eukprot:TRINITY_DN81026_c0_g1_i1.p1 TRINITY_DN81026_c0_g1~~TRINITY_DN81026_c0_g1_i1.p1  ORF type:complete len:140 (-),score=18.64 TRINITY_DN81026_c0_g1_i1:74-442(-)